MSAAIWGQPSEAEARPDTRPDLPSDLQPDADRSAPEPPDHVHVELSYDRDSTLWRLLLDGEPLTGRVGGALGWSSFNRAFDVKVRIENGEPPPKRACGAREAEPDSSLQRPSL